MDVAGRHERRPVGVRADFARPPRGSGQRIEPNEHLGRALRDRRRRGPRGRTVARRATALQRRGASPPLRPRGPRGRALRRVLPGGRRRRRRPLRGRVALAHRRAAARAAPGEPQPRRVEQPLAARASRLDRRHLPGGAGRQRDRGPGRPRRRLRRRSRRRAPHQLRGRGRRAPPRGSRPARTAVHGSPARADQDPDPQQRRRGSGRVGGNRPGPGRLAGPRPSPRSSGSPARWTT